MARSLLLCAVLLAVVLLSGCGSSKPTLPTPVVVIPTRAAATAVSGSPASTTIVSVPGYKDDDVKNYLVSLVYSNQIGGARVTHKWVQPIRYFVHGNTSAEDKAMVEAAIADVRSLTKLSITPAGASGQENLSIYFVPQTDYQQYGFSSPVDRAGYYLKAQGAIGDSDIGKTAILIDTGSVPTPLDAKLKASMVRGLLARILGMINNVTTYKDSVFTTMSTKSTVAPNPEYSPLDRKVIQLFYADTVKAGMTEEQLRAALNAMK